MKLFQVVSGLLLKFASVFENDHQNLNTFSLRASSVTVSNPVRFNCIHTSRPGTSAAKESDCQTANIRETRPRHRPSTDCGEKIRLPWWMVVMRMGSYRAH